MAHLTPSKPSGTANVPLDRVARIEHSPAACIAIPIRWFGIIDADDHIRWEHIRRRLFVMHPDRVVPRRAVIGTAMGQEAGLIERP